MLVAITRKAGTLLLFCYSMAAYSSSSTILLYSILISLSMNFFKHLFVLDNNGCSTTKIIHFGIQASFLHNPPGIAVLQNDVAD